MTQETITKLAQQFVNENYSMGWYDSEEIICKDNRENDKAMMVTILKEFARILEEEKRKCVFKVTIKIQ